MAHHVIMALDRSWQDGLAPKAFFLGPREMEEAGAEGYRLQEQLDVGNKCPGTCDLVGTTESMRIPFLQ